MDLACRPMNTPTKIAVAFGLVITATLLAKWEPLQMGEQRTNPATYGDGQHIGAVSCSSDGKMCTSARPISSGRARMAGKPGCS